MPTTKAVKKGIRIAISALTKEGYEVIPFPISREEIAEIKDIYLGLISNNPLKEFCEVIDLYHEESMPLYSTLFLIFRAGPLTRLLLHLLLRLSGNKRLSEGVKTLKNLSMEEQKKLLFRRIEILNTLKERFK